MAGLMTRLLLVIVLSCLISTAASDEACEIGTKSVSATCGVASAVLGFLGALLCVGTAGAACAPAFAGVAAVAGICSTGVSMVPCGGDGELLRTNPCHSFVVCTVKPQFAVPLSLPGSILFPKIPGLCVK